MAAMSRTLLLVIVSLLLSDSALAQNSKEVSITEPGIYQLADLFKRADSVVLAKIISGDAENYDVAVYKAEVLKSFKGAAKGEMIYFGPYVGERLGWEYILFLRNVSQSVAPKTATVAGYGTIHYAEIFDEGYSSMMTSYECVFDGKDTNQKCDYGVRVCTDYIKLPKRTPTFPPVAEETSFGCRWVRKTLFISLLDNFGSLKK